MLLEDIDKWLQLVFPDEPKDEVIEVTYHTLKNFNKTDLIGEDLNRLNNFQKGSKFFNAKWAKSVSEVKDTLLTLYNQFNGKVEFAVPIVYKRPDGSKPTDTRLGKKEATRAFVVAIDFDFNQHRDEKQLVDEELADKMRKHIDKVLEGFLKPSMIVASGGGLHYYFKLNREVSVDELEVIYKRIKQFHANLRGKNASERNFKEWFDISSANYAKGLRVPGTPNYKYGEAVFARIIYYNPDVENSVEDLLAAALSAQEQKVLKKRLDESIKRQTARIFSNSDGQIWGAYNRIIKQIQEQFDLIAFIKEKFGEDYFASENDKIAYFYCPFYELHGKSGKERHPSFAVYKNEDGHVAVDFHEYTGNGTEGVYNAITFVQRYFNDIKKEPKTFKEVVDYLAKQLNLELPKSEDQDFDAEEYLRSLGFKLESAWLEWIDGETTLMCPVQVDSRGMTNIFVANVEALMSPAKFAKIYANVAFRVIPTPNKKEMVAIANTLLEAAVIDERFYQQIRMLIAQVLMQRNLVIGLHSYKEFRSFMEGKVVYIRNGWAYVSFMGLYNQLKRTFGAAFALQLKMFKAALESLGFKFGYITACKLNVANNKYFPLRGSTIPIIKIDEAMIHEIWFAKFLENTRFFSTHPSMYLLVESDSVGNLLEDPEKVDDFNTLRQIMSFSVYAVSDIENLVLRFHKQYPDGASVLDLFSMVSSAQIQHPLLLATIIRTELAQFGRILSLEEWMNWRYKGEVPEARPEELNKIKEKHPEIFELIIAMYKFANQILEFKDLYTNAVVVGQIQDFIESDMDLFNSYLGISDSTFNPHLDKDYTEGLIRYYTWLRKNGLKGSNVVDIINNVARTDHPIPTGDNLKDVFGNKDTAQAVSVMDSPEVLTKRVEEELKEEYYEGKQSDTRVRDMNEKFDLISAAEKFGCNVSEIEKLKKKYDDLRLGVILNLIHRVSKDYKTYKKLFHNAKARAGFEELKKREPKYKLNYEFPNFKPLRDEEIIYTYDASRGMQIIPNDALRKHSYQLKAYQALYLIDNLKINFFPSDDIEKSRLEQAWEFMVNLYRTALKLFENEADMFERERMVDEFLCVYIGLEYWKRSLNLERFKLILEKQKLRKMKENGEFDLEDEKFDKHADITFTELQEIYDKHKKLEEEDYIIHNGRKITKSELAAIFDKYMYEKEDYAPQGTQPHMEIFDEAAKLIEQGQEPVEVEEKVINFAPHVVERIVGKDFVRESDNTYLVKDQIYDDIDIDKVLDTPLDDLLDGDEE